jgi:hypothetical protein
VIKVRDNDIDPNLREFSITDGGVSVSGTFTGTEGVLSGFAHTRAQDHPSEPEQT